MSATVNVEDLWVVYPELKPDEADGDTPYTFAADVARAAAWKRGEATYGKLVKSE